MKLNPEVWGPKYWFVLHTIALTYPLRPTSIVKKKYYEFIKNLHLFLPDEEIGAQFSNFLDKYPVTPYLDSRESFMKWVHFIHNRINVSLGKKTMNYDDSLKEYFKQYRKNEDIEAEYRRKREKYVYAIVFSGFVSLSIFLYLKK